MWSAKFILQFPVTLSEAKSLCFTDSSQSLY